MNNYARLMSEAIAVARKGIEAKQSPFGAVIATLDGKIVHVAHNVVRLSCDPTAHAEINAIRGACKRLGTIDLTGHLMATTCEPCPMCAAAIHWARLDMVVYGAGIEDAQQAGFNELCIDCEALYEMGGSNLKVEGGVLRDECKSLFHSWLQGPNPAPY